MNVDFLQNIYGKTLYENEKNIKFWESYLQDLDALDLNFLSEQLTVPILVPIGSRILFRGELKHTNEVTVALGADYFAKCSVKQAEALKEYRIKDAKAKLELLTKERDYLQNHISFSKQAVYDDTGYDIIEVVTEEEDKNWRKLHRENVKQYKQRKNKDDELRSDMTSEDVWNRLEELELQEELENELKNKKTEKHKSTELPSSSKAKHDEEEEEEDEEEEDDDDEDDDDDSDDDATYKPYNDDDYNDAKVVNEIYLAHYYSNRKIFQQPSKLHLFELVVDRHNSLKEMVAELRAKQKRSKTEEDLVGRLNDMEKLEELEDEIAMLEDMLASDDDDDDDIDKGEDEEYQLKKSVAFADEEDSETFELTFKHSEVKPSEDSYDPKKGITKPSDICQAYSNIFNGETTSILKKSKSGNTPVSSQSKPISKQREVEEEINQESNLNTTIVVGDVIEKVEIHENSVNHNARPMSLFKKRRQQSKE